MEQMKNIIRPDDRMSVLKAQLAALDGPARRPSLRRPRDREAFPDVWETGVVHDLYAQTPADAVAVNGFGLGLALQTAGGRAIVWGLHEMMGHEAGRPHGPGLSEMGLRPADVLLVWARDIQTLLAIGEEALRTPTVGAVLLSAWGEGRALSLTASRRLALAAAAGGGTLFLARAGAVAAPSAAESRWSVRAVASVPLEDGAPGHPSFSATLLRRRGGGAPKTWTMEWDRDEQVFRDAATLSGAVVPLAAQRPVETGGTDRRRVA
jgi:protein ImuA